MNNCLVDRVSQLEVLFEKAPYTNSDTMVKNHLVSLLDESGYKKHETLDNTYHKIENNKINLFGFKYKRQDQLYHIQFDNIEEANSFLDYNEKSNSSGSIFSLFIYPLSGFLAGLAASIAAASLTDNPDSWKDIAPLISFSGAGIGFVSALASEGDNDKEIANGLKKSSEKIKTDIDAIKSAVGGYLNE